MKEGGGTVVGRISDAKKVELNTLMEKILNELHQ
jgi:hypothetical protein